MTKRQREEDPSSVFFFNVNLLHANVAKYLTLVDKSNISRINKRAYERFGQLSKSLNIMRQVHLRHTVIEQVSYIVGTMDQECILYIWDHLNVPKHYFDVAACETNNLTLLRMLFDHYIACKTAFGFRRKLEVLICELLTYRHSKTAFDLVMDKWGAGPLKTLRGDELRRIWHHSIRSGCKSFPRKLQRERQVWRNKSTFNLLALRDCLKKGLLNLFDYWWYRSSKEDRLEYYNRLIDSLSFEKWDLVSQEHLRVRMEEE